MFEDYTIGEYLINMIRMGVGGFISGKFLGLGKAIHAFISSALILCVVVHGIRSMAGDIVNSGKELAITSVLLLIGIGITEPSVFSNMIYTPIVSTKDNLASFVMINSSSASIFDAFSEANSRMFAHASNIVDIAGWSDIDLWGMAFIIYLVYGIYYLLFIGITAYTELSLGVVMLLGSLILPLSAFQSARQLGKSWIIAVIKYSFAFVIISFLVGIMNIITDQVITALMNEIYIENSIDGDVIGLDSPTLGGVLLFGVFGGYMLFQSIEFAAEMTGGVMTDGAKGVTSVVNTAKTSLKTMNTLGSMGKNLGKLKQRSTGA